MKTQTAAQRDTLAWSSLPLANQAVAAGHEARRAGRAANYARERYAAMATRALPENLTARERGWAYTNRINMLAEADAAEANARTIWERWARLMDQLVEIASDELYEAIDATVWVEGQ